MVSRTLSLPHHHRPPLPSSPRTLCRPHHLPSLHHPRPDLERPPQLGLFPPCRPPDRRFRRLFHPRQLLRAHRLPDRCHGTHSRRLHARRPRVRFSSEARSKSSQAFLPHLHRPLVLRPHPHHQLLRESPGQLAHPRLFHPLHPHRLVHRHAPALARNLARMAHVVLGHCHPRADLRPHHSRPRPALPGCAALHPTQSSK